MLVPQEPSVVTVVCARWAQVVGFMSNMKFLSCAFSDFPTFIYLLVVGVSRASTHKWRSEDNLWKSVLILPCAGHLCGKWLCLLSHLTDLISCESFFFDIESSFSP